MKDIETLVDDLFYLMSEGIHRDYEYRQRKAETETALGKLLKVKRVNSPYESYLKYVLENIETLEECCATQDIPEENILSDIENAMDEREMQAIKIACRAGILCGINYCKNKGMAV